MPVDLETRAGVARLRIDDAAGGNALGPALVAELTGVFATASADPSVAAIIIGSEGRVFAADPPDGAQPLPAAQAVRLLMQVQGSLKPTLAAVRGSVSGLGVGLVAACDVTIASEEADFQVADVRAGRVPSAVLPFLLHAMGMRHTRRWLVSGDRFRAADAHNAGLVHEVAPRALFDARVDQAVVGLLRAQPKAVSGIKALLDDLGGLPSIAELQRIADAIDGQD